MGDLPSAITLSYGMDVITPAIIASPVWSAPGEPGRSIDATEDPLVCLDDLDPLELVLSRSPPKNLPSSLAFLFSFLPVLEKNDLPPDDCRDLLSTADIIDGLGIERPNMLMRNVAVFQVPVGYVMRLSSKDFRLCSSVSRIHVVCIMPPHNHTSGLIPLASDFDVSRICLH